MREHSFIFLNKNLPNSARALRMCTFEIEKKNKCADFWEANCGSGGVDPQSGGEEKLDPRGVVEAPDQWRD